MQPTFTFKATALAASLLALSACSTTGEETEGSDVTTTPVVETPETPVKVDAPEPPLKLDPVKAARDALDPYMVFYFDFDQSNIRKDYADLLEKHAAYLKMAPTAKVVIEGHADERGTPEYNIALGERRAQAVSRYLQSLGVQASQISTVSYGEEKPVDTSRTEAAFDLNRRAVLVY